MKRLRGVWKQMTALAKYGATVNTDPRVREVGEIVNEVLGGDQVCLTLLHMSLDEDIPTSKAKVSATIEIERAEGTRNVDIEGTGVGLLDAFFDGLVAFFAREYPSLNTLTILDYRVEFDHGEHQGRNTDADAKAILRVQNSDDLEFEFAQQTPSVTYSSALAAINVINFFINSEMAYVRMHMALNDAVERRRSDLVETYRAKMAVLVHATSYSEVVKRLDGPNEQR